MMHHIEIYVSNLKTTINFYDQLLLDVLGYEVYQRWERGISYQKDGFYIVFVQANHKKVTVPYNRTSVGLNHLAFKIDTVKQLDALRDVYLADDEVTVLYDDCYPFAGGKDHYALYFEDPDRIKLEVVAMDFISHSANPTLTRSTDDVVSIREIGLEDLRSWWEIAYGPEADLEWKKWDGPYFNDPVLSWEAFRNGFGGVSVGNPNRRLILVNDEIVGLVTAHWEDDNLRQWMEFGIAIYRSDLWQKGYGRQALELWIPDLFERYPYIRRVGYTTWSGNKRMLALGEKLGMTLEAKVRQVRFYEGKYYDSIKYGILREEYEKMKK